jgi:vacuolar-type H+-ATPase subunit E/Vma4
MSDATAEAEEVLVTARARAQEIRARGRAQAEAERQAILNRARQEAERLHGQAISTTQLKVRNDQLAFREQLLDRVFVSVRDQIPSVQKWNNYEEIAISLLKEALHHLKDYPVQVRADPTIHKLISREKLDQIAAELGVEVTDYRELEQGTGVIVETADGHLNFDNTLETRLARMQNALRAPVYHILMGEQV